jgi:hypothetical protein
MAEKIAEIIGRYVKYRAARKILKAEYDAKDKPLKDAMAKMEGELGAFLTATGADSIASDNGTAYTTVKLSATIKDMVAFKDYVIGNSCFSLVDWKANAKAVEAFTKSQKCLPPGVKFTSFEKVNVRKGDGLDESDDE